MIVVRNIVYSFLGLCFFYNLGLCTGFMMSILNADYVPNIDSGGPERKIYVLYLLFFLPLSLSFICFSFFPNRNQLLHFINVMLQHFE
jgi:hypothetical protein